MASTKYASQNQLLLSKLLEFYEGTDYLDKMLDIINDNPVFLCESLIGFPPIMQKSILRFMTLNKRTKPFASKYTQTTSVA